MDLVAYLAVLVSVASDELTYLAVALVLLITRRDLGRRLAISTLTSMLVNLLVKHALNVPRPRTYHQIIDHLPWYLSLFVAGEGPSLPSGHTQVSATFWLELSLATGKLPSYVLAAVFPVLVAYSRLVLGVHTVVDVAVALIVGYSVPLAYRALARVPPRSA